MKRPSLTAKSLQYILSLILVIMFAGGGAGFYFVQKQLRNFANQTSQLNSQVAASEQNLNNLRELKQYLATHQDDQALANQVVTDSQNYQEDILHDISTFASESGVTVLSYTFDAAAPSTTTTPATSSMSATGAGGATTPATGVSGLKEKTFNVLIKSPVNYRNLLEFISHIEQNVTRMQITSVSLSSDSTNKSDVSTDGFEIGVYVR